MDRKSIRTLVKNVYLTNKFKNENEDAGNNEQTLHLEEDEDVSEDDLSIILSTDSEDSSLEELRTELEALQEKEDRQRTEKISEIQFAKDESLERLYFYSIYIDILPEKKEQTVTPQTSEDVDTCKEYEEEVKLAKDLDAARYVIDEIDEEEFNDFINTDIKEDEGIDDIDGNISIRTMCEKNFNKLRMDGPSRRVALVFSYKSDGKPISDSFRHFMHIQKVKFPFVSGVLLYYNDVGIHIVEGSEHILLLHFPQFFKAECFKKLNACKVLGVEELSPMKFFEQYSCYKGKSPKCRFKIPKNIGTYEGSTRFMRKIGRSLDIFMKHVYNDYPSVTEDNKIPESVQKDLPPKEFLDFALSDDKWVPGLRDVKMWYHHLTFVPGETNNAGYKYIMSDNSGDGREVDDIYEQQTDQPFEGEIERDYVWPARSDLMPVHILHPAPGEEECIKEMMLRKLKDKKLQMVSPFQTGEVAKTAEQLPGKQLVVAGDSDEDDFEGVKKIASKSSLFDLEKLDGELEDILDVEEQSDDD